MLYFNRDELRDHIYACWKGKNIGGTMGTPYEGKREIMDIQGFVTKEGEVLPNDDLDLQLIWLKAMEEQGPNSVNERVLGEYWLTYIGPNWNEYGVGKNNIRDGFVPPISGEIMNDEWRNSNGAWIRSEIWASLYPGQPDQAIRYAYYDACVDHGYGEGTYAAIFTAALESMAYVLKDIPQLLELALSKIPEGCRVARSVRLVMNAYKDGIDWKTARNMVVEDSADLGWFQAPANVAFVILGLLYGGGDFKKSMILAINCGDDTDCTGATVGALMGILYGSAGIPEDWSRYLGDDIVTCCLLKGHGIYPATCTQLTDIVMNMLNVTLHQPFNTRLTASPAIVHDGETDFSQLDVNLYAGSAFAEALIRRKRYSFEAENLLVNVLVEFDEEPRLEPNGELTGRITVRQRTFPEQKHYQLEWILPEGWRVSGRRALYYNPSTIISYQPGEPMPGASAPFTLTAGEEVAAKNELLLKISVTGRSMPLIIPINILG